MSIEKEKKVVRQIRISPSLDEQLTLEANATGMSKTAILEKALYEYLNNEKDAAIRKITADVLEGIDEKYGNLFTRLRLGTRTAEQNSTVLLDLANTMLLLNDVDEYAFMPVSEAESALISKSKDKIKKMIEVNKQKKDNAAIGEDR